MTDLVGVLVDLVRRPVDTLERRLGDDVGSALKQEWDTVGKAMDIDAGLG
jgi:hypothetical protein